MQKHTIFLVIFLVFSFKSHSQITFENGYFIDETGERTNCLIKNVDWKNNPTEFHYKVSRDSPIQKAGIAEVREFGIANETKFIREIVQMDKSSDHVSSMSTEKDPVFEEKELFLKTLVEGKASLYYFMDKGLTRFFYSLDDSEIKQLVYKRYLKNGGIARNSTFKNELYQSLECANISSDEIANLNYNQKDLEEFFISYNECVNSNYQVYESTKKRDALNLSIRPGLVASSLKIENEEDFKAYDFGSQVNFRLGIELEYILPFNRDKWAIILEPNYSYFKGEDKAEVGNVSGGILVSRIDYQNIEVPIGMRHYFYLNNDSKIFANIAYVFDFPGNSNIVFTREDGSHIKSLSIDRKRNLNIGIGYKYLDKFSAEVRYELGKDILGNYSFWHSEYNSVALIFGYTLF